MNRIIFAALVLVGCAVITACGGENTPTKVEKMEFSGSPDRNSVDMAVTGEARAAIGSLQTALKGLLLTKYEGNADKLGKAVSGPLTEARANELLGGSLDSNHYKTSDYTISYLGGGKFNISVAPGTPKYVQQDIAVK